MVIAECCGITIEVITFYIEMGMECLRLWHLNIELDEVTEQAFSGEGHSKQRAAGTQTLRCGFAWLVHDKQDGWNDSEKGKKELKTCCGRRLEILFHV